MVRHEESLKMFETRDSRTVRIYLVESKNLGRVVFKNLNYYVTPICSVVLVPVLGFVPRG